MVAFIDQHRETYGVEPICAVLPIAPSTYFQIKSPVQSPKTSKSYDFACRLAGFAFNSRCVRIIRFMGQLAHFSPAEGRAEGRPIHGIEESWASRRE